MIFKDYSKYDGQHAFLSASKYAWLNYDVQDLQNAYLRSVAAKKGTRLHAFAAECIKLRQRLRGSTQTLSRYVNDAISFRMTPEQVLYYSDNCFGTADAISFDEKTLRIHDLKTGDTPAKFDQLKIYAAIFCMDYDVDPKKINIILRIYQNDSFLELTPEADEINFIMDKIVAFDNIIENMNRKDMDT